MDQEIMFLNLSEPQISINVKSRTQNPGSAVAASPEVHLLCSVNTKLLGLANPPATLQHTILSLVEGKALKKIPRMYKYQIFKHKNSKLCQFVQLLSLKHIFLFLNEDCSL